MREHEVDGCIVFDARVRSFPPQDPIVLRWNYPLWERDHGLDPTNLKTGRKARNADKAEPVPDEEKPEPWTVDRFVAAFITDEPQPQQVVIDRATMQGMPEREAAKLVRLATADRKAFVWRLSTANKNYIANIEQPVTWTK